jgi:hypothetical protein
MAKAQSLDIAPGTRVNVKVTKPPTNAAAAKTIARVLSKDATVKAHNKRLAKHRKNHTPSKQRGGREWFQRIVKQHPVEGKVGESGTVTATVDVLNDLASVSRFVEVKPA